MKAAPALDVNALAKALNSAIGKNAEEDKVTNWLSTGYSPLNEIISNDPDGGIPYARIVEIYGPPAAGKTVLATWLMREAQLAGGVAAFMDWERSFSAGFAEQQGLNTAPGQFVYKKPTTWEEGNSIAMKLAAKIRKERLIAPEAPIICVCDSVAAAVPQSVYDTVQKKDLEGLSMNDTTALARVSSSTLKIINQAVSEYNMIMVYLNQMRIKPGVVYGDPTTTPGGSAFEFYASVRLAIGAQKIQQEVTNAQGKKEKQLVGRLMGITTKKNKLARPFQEVSMRLSYDELGACSFDRTTSLVDHLIEKAILKRPTAQSVTWTDGNDYSRKELVEKLVQENAYEQLDALIPRPPKK